MKKSSVIVQWIFASVLGLLTLGNGLHWSSILLLLGTVLLMPIPAIRNIFKKFNVKSWIVITTSVIVVLAGICCSPLSQENNISKNTIDVTHTESATHVREDVSSYSTVNPTTKVTSTNDVAKHTTEITSTTENSTPIKASAETSVVPTLSTSKPTLVTSEIVKPSTETTKTPAQITPTPSQKTPTPKTPTPSQKTPAPKTPTLTDQITNEELVWIPTNGGKKYHSKSSCSKMIDPLYVTKEEAIEQGFTACGRCYR